MDCTLVEHLTGVVECLRVVWDIGTRKEIAGGLSADWWRPVCWLRWHQGRIRR